VKRSEPALPRSGQPAAAQGKRPGAKRRPRRPGGQAGAEPNGAGKEAPPPPASGEDWCEPAGPGPIVKPRRMPYSQQPWFARLRVSAHSALSQQPSQIPAPARRPRAPSPLPMDGRSGSPPQTRPGAGQTSSGAPWNHLPRRPRRHPYQPLKDPFTDGPTVGDKAHDIEFLARRPFICASAREAANSGVARAARRRFGFRRQQATQYPTYWLSAIAYRLFPYSEPACPVGRGV